MIECTFENGKKASGGLRHVTVGVIVFNDHNQVLLIKRSDKFSRPGKYSVPGGFLDRNENAEQAALRELKEEAGFDGEIMGVFHINDYPNRPNEDRQNVDFVYLAKVEDGNFVPNEEIDEIKWVGKEELPSDDQFAFDHRATILKAFDYLENKFPLPLMGKI